MLRKNEDETEIAAVLSSDDGNVIVWSDAGADPNGVYSYSILPRHRLFYESGSLLTGPESESVTYSPPGILNRIFGVETLAQ